MDWNWKQRLINEKENEFFQWLQTWYEEHVRRPLKIIAEMKWNCYYKNRETMGPCPIINPVGVGSGEPHYINNITEQIVFYHKDIFYEINRVTVRIVQYPEANRNYILLVDDKSLTQNIADKLEQNLTSIRKKFLLAFNRYKTDYKKDNNNAKNTLKKAEEHDRCIMTETPTFATSYEKALCHMVSIYILHYDWINRNVSNKSFLINSLESKKKHKLLTVKELLDVFSKEYDLGFNSLIKFVETHKKKIEIFDLIPPEWFKYLPKQTDKSEKHTQEGIEKEKSRVSPSQSTTQEITMDSEKSREKEYQGSGIIKKYRGRPRKLNEEIILDLIKRLKNNPDSIPDDIIKEHAEIYKVDSTAVRNFFRDNRRFLPKDNKNKLLKDLTENDIKYMFQKRKESGHD